MAPEAPGNLLVVDARFAGDDLVGTCESVDYPPGKTEEIERAGGWLDVFWNGTPVGDDFSPLGGGVVYVRPPEGYELGRLPAAFDALGNREFAYRHPARGEGFMFVMILPEGFTLAGSTPTARSVKEFRGRLAVYWKPEGKYSAEVAVRWKLVPQKGDLIQERNRLNRVIYSSKIEPTNAGTNIIDRCVFIGHGRSESWRVLKDFLSDKLRLPYEEFNRQSAAGLATKERLQQMLNSTTFAFLVMTAEDEHADGSKHARENVVHEIGLFQGRHGFERAIVLLEDGCNKFSNIDGVTHIAFPKGNIMAASEEIRDVLIREGFLTST